MFHLTIFGISGLWIAVPYFVLAFLLFSRGQKNQTRLTQVLALFCLAVGIWGSCAFIIGTVRHETTAFIVWLLAMSDVFFIPVLFYHTACILTEQKRDIFLLLFYLLGIFFLYVTATGDLYSVMPVKFHSIYYIRITFYGWAYILLWLGIFSFAQLRLTWYYRKHRPGDRRIFLALIVATPFGFIGGASNFLPTLGIDIYPFGNFLIIIFCLLVVYAALKDRLVDLAFVIQRSVAYYILIAFVTLVYMLSVFSFERLTQHVLGYQSMAIGMAIAFVLGLVLIPFRNKVQALVDGYFFKGTVLEIADQNESLRQEIVRSERYKSLAAITANISDEIKNPLTAIMGYAHFLEQKHNDPEFIAKFSKVLKEQSTKINDLLLQLKEYGQVVPLSHTETDLNRLIDDTLVMLKGGLLVENISIQRDFDPQNAVLAVDVSHLRQAVINIITNAAESMTEARQLIVTTRGERDKFTISVKDTGCGIKKDDLVRIFDPLYTTKPGHIGLGLSTTQGIVDKHGGKIYVLSTVGQGSEFIIELPRKG